MKTLDAYRATGLLLSAVLIFMGELTAQTITGTALLTPDIGSVVFSPVRCDSRGYIYLQPPLSKFDRNGNRTAVFDLTMAERDGWSNTTAAAFAVDSDGKLFQLLRTDEQRAVIVEFGADGRYLGSVLLEQEFVPLQLGVLNEGTFVIAGLRPMGLSTEPLFEPYTALYDRSGRLVKLIDTQEPSVAPLDGAGNPNPRGLEFTIAESDGKSVYLLRPGAEPTMIVISSSGLMERKLTLRAPGPDLRVSAFRVGGGKVLVEYVQPKAYQNGNAAYHMVVYDALTGDRVSGFTRRREITGILGCTDWQGGFTFLSADVKGRRTLVGASVR